MREDIVAGLKNAFERGESMEKAVNAFINAGYNKNEVEEAAKSLGFLNSKQEQTSQTAQPESVPQKPQFQPLPKSPSLTKELPIPNAPSPPQTTPAVSNTPSAPSPAKKPKSKWRMLNIMLGIIGLILLVIIGISAWNYFMG